MAPPRRISKQQLELLMNFLEANKEMSKGLVPGTPVSHQQTRQKWACLAKRLNAVQGGALKTPDGWKKYWFEWRHKCRKKARRKYQKDASGDSDKCIPFNELEVRALELCGEGALASSESASRNDNDDNDDDSDSMPLENVKAQSAPIKIEEKIQANDAPMPVEVVRVVSPPPQWAIDLEERRITAEERSAVALESIASVMRGLEERRVLLEERLAEALNDIAGTVQDLNSRLQEAVEHLQKIHPAQSNENEPDMKNIFM